MFSHVHFMTTLCLPPFPFTRLVLAVVWSEHQVSEGVSLGTCAGEEGARDNEQHHCADAAMAPSNASMHLNLRPPSLLVCACLTRSLPGFCTWHRMASLRQPPANAWPSIGSCLNRG